MLYTDDPIADFHRYDQEQAKREAEREAQLPKCDYCGEPIPEHYYEINGCNVCPDCLDKHFRKDVDLG